MEPQKIIRAAVYTRKSSEEGLEQEFNSLDAQREACKAYIASQKHEGWVLVDKEYSDGGISGGTLNRPAVQDLLQDIKTGLVNMIAEGAVPTGNIKGTAEHLPTIQHEHQHGKINPKYKNRMFSAKRAFCAMDGRQKAASQLCLSKFRHPVNLDTSDIPVLEFEQEIAGERVRDKKIGL